MAGLSLAQAQGLESLRLSVFPITAHYRNAWKSADLPKMSFCGVEADGFAWDESVQVCARDRLLSSIVQLRISSLAQNPAAIDRVTSRRDTVILMLVSRGRRLSGKHLPWQNTLEELRRCSLAGGLDIAEVQA